MKTDFMEAVKTGFNGSVIVWKNFKNQVCGKNAKSFEKLLKFNTFVVCFLEIIE